MRDVRAAMARSQPYVYQGTVEEVRGLSVRASGLPLAIGEMVTIDADEPVAAEVVGFLPDHRVYLLPFDELRGVRAGTAVWSRGRAATIPVGPSVLGRVLDGLGRPLDGGRLVWGAHRALSRKPDSPLNKRPIATMMPTGVRAIDGLLTIGRGQRVGIFAGAGVGKTTLLHMMLKGAKAPVAVVALIGERGREVAQFVREMDAVTLRRTVVLAATSEAPALMRVRVGQAAMTVAEEFRERGTDVLLVMDSLTRLAMAQREVGLQSGEIASSRGYTPSVFQLLPRILERAGRHQSASITGLYTVLLDSDDPNDPVGDAVRGILDGHIYLSRELAERHHFPAIDVPRSLSRVMPDLVDAAQGRVAAKVRQLLDRLDRSKDLISLGAYQPGSDRELEFALAVESPLRDWLDQELDEWAEPEPALADLRRLLMMESSEEARDDSGIDDSSV